MNILGHLSSKVFTIQICLPSKGVFQIKSFSIKLGLHAESCVVLRRVYMRWGYATRTWRTPGTSMINNIWHPGTSLRVGFCPPGMTNFVPGEHFLFSGDVPGKYYLISRDLPGYQILIIKDLPGKWYLYSRNNNLPSWNTTYVSLLLFYPFSCFWC